MSITTFEKLLPLLDIKDTKGIKEQKMCNWFQQIVSIPINMRNRVTNLHRLKKKYTEKEGPFKGNFSTRTI